MISRNLFSFQFIEKFFVWNEEFEIIFIVEMKIKFEYTSWLCLFHVFRDKFIHSISYASNYFYITNCGLHNWDEVMRISSHTKNRDVLWLQIMNLLLDFHNKRKEDTWCNVNPFLHYKCLFQYYFVEVKLWNHKKFLRCCFWFMRK